MSASLVVTRADSLGAVVGEMQRGLGKNLTVARPSVNSNLIYISLFLPSAPDFLSLGTEHCCINATPALGEGPCLFRPEKFWNGWKYLRKYYVCFITLISPSFSTRAKACLIIELLIRYYKFTCKDLHWVKSSFFAVQGSESLKAQWVTAQYRWERLWIWLSAKMPWLQQGCDESGGTTIWIASGSEEGL